MTAQIVEAAPAQALAALFDDGTATPAVGDPLPALWHWVCLARWSPYGTTGTDGHPRPTDLPPELEGRRRMFAGGRVRLHRPVHVGERVEVDEEIISITPKRGRRGDFALVQARRHVTDQSGNLAIEETRDLVYTDVSPAASRPGDGPSDDGSLTSAPVPSVLHRHEDDRHWVLRTDPVALMRFSAATANAHRIHYDWRYATQVEGYRSLVVHGPLMTLALAEVARLERPTLRPVELTHRNLGPLFCGQSAGVDVDQTAAGLDLTLHREGDPLVTLSCAGAT